MKSPKEPQTESQPVAKCPECKADVYLGERFCAECGSPVPEAEEAGLLADLRGVTLGEYDIVGGLGRGGMGVVFLAHEIALGRKVAIKVLLPSLLRGTAVVERFRREARIAASLRHRNITSIFGFKETSKLMFFVMEYVEGRGLESILAEVGGLPDPVARVVLHDVASALSYAHQRDITHRDVKPANVIIDKEGIAVVTDFGVAKISDAEGLTSTGSAVGSPRYMSPEQWSGEATHLSDQYSLGCVAYQMLSGELPCEADSIETLMKKQLFEAPEDLRTVRPDCPAELAAAVMRMLEKDPAQRWPSLNEALAAIGAGSVAPDDPARAHLAELAKKGHEVRELPTTPQSPISVARARVRTPPPTAPAKRWTRMMPWAALALVVVAASVATYQLAIRRGGGPAPAEVDRPELSEAGAPGGEPAAMPPVDTGAVEATTESATETVQQVEGPATETTEQPVRTEPREPQTPVQPTEETEARSQPPRPAAAPQTGILQMLIRPVWAEVSIDGISRGTRQRGVDTLVAGVPHRLHFERPGFLPVDTTVTLQPGETLLLRIQLRPSEQ